MAKESIIAFLMGALFLGGLFWLAGVNFTQRGGELAFCVLVSVVCGFWCAIAWQGSPRPTRGYRTLRCRCRTEY